MTDDGVLVEVVGRHSHEINDNRRNISELREDFRQIELRVERSQEEQRRALADFAGEMRGRWDEARKYDTEAARARDEKIGKVATQTDQILGGLLLIKWALAALAVPFLLGALTLLIEIVGALLGWGEFGTWVWHKAFG
ncbi:hypothetical protein [Novacetimonas hansenii]|uniref:hypothetical protein n=1 Tax=Novacetimonas hansenii TaxID=436 RepID=UPI00094F8528|nr:hypothetical protein [Novacetimonas hansenii]